MGVGAGATEAVGLIWTGGCAEPQRAFSCSYCPKLQSAMGRDKIRRRTHQYIVHFRNKCVYVRLAAVYNRLPVYADTESKEAKSSGIEQVIFEDGRPSEIIILFESGWS